MRIILAAVLAMGLAGCARIHIVCPPGTIGVTMSGNNVGTGLIALGTSAAKVGGFAAIRESAAAPSGIDPNLTTIDYSTWPGFGPEGEMCVQPTSPKPIDVNVVSTVKAPQ